MEITKESNIILNDLSTYVHGLLFLAILSCVMLLVHIFLDFIFHIVN